MTTGARSDQTAEFSISYEGTALEQHTMPVRDLAPALLALGQAFDRANTLLNGNRASVSLDIRATAQGSFEVQLILLQSLEDASAFLSDDFLTSALKLKDLLIGSGIGVGYCLIAVIRWMKGRKPKATVQPEGDVLLEIDNMRLRVPSKVWSLAKDRPLREHLEAVVRPLLRPGVSRLVIRENREIIEAVEEDDVQSFSYQEDVEERISETNFQQVLQIVSLNFEGGKWRLSDGETVRFYGINDEAFVNEIQERRKAFRYGDKLVCDVAMRQYSDDQGRLRTEYEIVRVIKHESPPTQLHLSDAKPQSES